MDDDNFEFILDGRKFVMSGGELIIDGCGYDDDDDDPIYSLVRAYWRLANSEKKL